MKHPAITNPKGIEQLVINAPHPRHEEQRAKYVGELIDNSGKQHHLFQYIGLRLEFCTINYLQIHYSLKWARENHNGGLEYET